jgi:hypothetical protein
MPPSTGTAVRDQSECCPPSIGILSAINRNHCPPSPESAGAEAWAYIASLIESCRLNGVDPEAYLADVLEKLVNGWPAARIGELLPWAYAKPAANAPEIKIAA